MTPPRLAGLFLGLLILALAGCTPSPSAAPTQAPSPVLTATTAPTAAPSPTSASIPSTTPPPTEAIAATPAPTATAGAELPVGWRRETNAQLSIAIPPGWRSIELTGEDAQTAFDAIKQNDPTLAGIIGGPENLQGAAFWAFGPEQGDFVDNLNIRRTPLGSQRVTDLQQVIDVLLPEYDKMGLKVTSTDATVRVHKLPAARVTYTMQMNTADGKGQEVRGRQVIVATDTDLWVLSFSTVPEREGALAADFELSAQSFEPK